MHKGKKRDNLNSSLLLESSSADGTFRIFWDQAKEATKAYSSLLVNSIGLVVGDASYLFKLTFTPLVKGSTLRKWRDDHKEFRNSKLREMGANLDRLEEMSGENGLLMFSFAPHVLVADKALRIATLENKSAFEFIDDIGLSQIPIIGNVHKSLERNDNLMDKVDWQDPDDIERYHRQFLEKLNDSGNNNKYSDSSPLSIVGKAWDWTQAIFLGDFRSNESTVTKKNILTESVSDSTIKVPENIKSAEDYRDWLLSEVIKKNVYVDTKELLDNRKKNIEEILNASLEVLNSYALLTASRDLHEFWEALEKLNQKVDKKINISEMQKTIKDKTLELMKDKKIQEEYQKNLKDKSKAKDEKAYLDYIEKGVLMSAKEKLLPSLRTMFVDLRDTLEDDVTEGCTPELLKLMSKHEEYLGLVKQINEQKDQIKKSIEPLLNAQNIK